MILESLASVRVSGVVYVTGGAWHGVLVTSKQSEPALLWHYARMVDEDKTETWTTSDWGCGKGPVADPVVALAVWPKGPRFVFRDFQDERGSRKKWLLLGRLPTCDVVLGKQALKKEHLWKTVNRRHCLVCCTPAGHVRVKRSQDEGTNSTVVNGTRLHDGTATLRPNDVLRLGKVRLVALTQAMLDGTASIEPRVAASSNPAEFFRRSRDLHGSQNTAAKRFDMSPKTLSDWLRGKRFKRNG